MTDQYLTQARRRPVDPLFDTDYDYADAFEIDLPQAETRSPGELFRATVDDASFMPLVVLAHRWVLRFRLGPLSSPDHLFGWRLVASEPDVIRLEADRPMMRGIIIGRRESRSTAVLTTYVTYVRRGPARVIWALVGPVHRGVAPHLLERAASRRAAAT
jgi:hypothetical protein